MKEECTGRGTLTTVQLPDEGRSSHHNKRDEKPEFNIPFWNFKIFSFSVFR